MISLDRRRLLALSVTAPALTAPVITATLPVVLQAAERQRELRFPLRLSANENPWGPGPAARAALAASIDESCRYPGEVTNRLVAAIAAKENVAPDRILIGTGSAEILNMLALGYCMRGRLVSAWPTFNYVHAMAAKLEAEVVRVPVDQNLRHDLGAMAAAAKSPTGLIYVCNPNNPTGTVVPADALREFCRSFGERTLVAVDEAYLDFADPAATASVVDLVRADANVVVLRTFSKIHGLAGLRIGYAIARPDIIRKLRGLQLAIPNGPGHAAALASLGDADFLRTTRTALLADRARIVAACDALGIACSATQGNFLFMKTGLALEEFRAQMRNEKIEVGRPFEPLLDWCRITVGTSAETTAFITALRKIKGVRA
jgi:histidinol-phosphate aminotransferase